MSMADNHSDCLPVFIEIAVIRTIFYILQTLLTFFTDRTTFQSNKLL